MLTPGRRGTVPSGGSDQALGAGRGPGKWRNTCGLRSGGPVLPPWVSSDGDGPHGGVQVRTETACRDPPGPTFRVLQGRLLAEGQGLAGTTGGALTPARGPGEDAAVPSRTGPSPAPALPQSRVRLGRWPQPADSGQRGGCRGPGPTSATVTHVPSPPALLRVGPPPVTWGRARCQSSSGEAHLLSPNSLWAPEPPLLASQRPR